MTSNTDEQMVRQALAELDGFEVRERLTVRLAFPAKNAFDRILSRTIPHLPEGWRIHRMWEGPYTPWMVELASPGRLTAIDGEGTTIRAACEAAVAKIKPGDAMTSTTETEIKARAREIAAKLLPHTTSVHNVEIIKSALLAERKHATPAGWKLVPAEPTEEMIHAAVMTHVRENKGIEHSPYLSYKAMLAAAPPIPQTKG